ncbi:hypothetical protein KEHDKFFH_02510 [Marinobacter maroccanus]|uniref:Uncharacterized protein n=1 Tax=Marinobacter maroccanus TaxID=2055143 RepID=A0A2S5ZGA1_9GAMM|nr:hypothetical protein [Marinobacter maroccanus]PPI86212.1 hypothetical protein KEHDKFFH_02510 [Marinobacter maroccanus]
MSLMQATVTTVADYPGLLCAFDFSQTDTQTLEAVSTNGAISGTVTFPQGVTIGGDGVNLDGTQSAQFAGDSGDTPLTVLFIVTPTTADTFELYHNSYASRDTILSVEAGNPRFYYKSAYNNSENTINHTAAISLDKVNLIGFHTKNRESNGQYSLELGLAGETVNRESAVFGRGPYHSYSSATLFRSAFAGIANGMLVFDRQLTEAELDEILYSLNIYGQISLPTNLNPDRFQSGAVLTAGRTIEGNFELPAGGSTLSHFSTSQKGTPLEFVAFDTDEDGSVYKTSPLDPSTASELDFQAILGGSGGGDSGQSSKVSGVVQIDGTPAKRTVRAFGYDPTAHGLDGATVNLSKSLGHSTSDPETGEYTIDLLSGYDKRIFVVAFDDYGDDFTPDMTVAVGDRIHPTTPNGHVWECTGAGTLPSEEPTWVVDTETTQLYGTASMIAKPFYRPMVHGPVLPEIYTPEVPGAGPQPLYIVGAGFDHSAVLKPDGTVAVWGGNYWGQVSDYPAGLSNVVAIACGGYFTAALKDDGSIVVWGGTSSAEASPPANGPYVQIAGNAYNGAAIREDGTVDVWGRDGLTVPATVNSVGAKFIEGWGDFFLAVLNDGSVVRIGPGPTIPADLPPVAFAGAGRNHGYVIFEDGTVQGFGDNGSGQINTPAGFGDCRQIAGGRYHTIALTQGGALEHWGSVSSGVGQLPAGSDFIAMSSGKDICLAVRQDGTVETWGTGDPVPSGVTAKVS